MSVGIPSRKSSRLNEPHRFILIFGSRINGTHIRATCVLFVCVCRRTLTRTLLHHQMTDTMLCITAAITEEKHTHIHVYKGGKWLKEAKQQTDAAHTLTHAHTQPHTERAAMLRFLNSTTCVECSSNANIAYMHEIFLVARLPFRSVLYGIPIRTEMSWKHGNPFSRCRWRCAGSAGAVASVGAGASDGDGDGAVIAKMKENKNRYRNQLMERLPRFCCPFLVARRLRVPHILSLSLPHITNHTQALNIHICMYFFLIQFILIFFLIQNLSWRTMSGVNSSHTQVEAIISAKISKPFSAAWTFTYWKRRSMWINFG